MRQLVRGIGGVVVGAAFVAVGLVVLLAIAFAASFLLAARPDLVWIALYLGASLTFIGWSARRLRRH